MSRARKAEHLAMLLADPFCSATCARASYGVVFQNTPSEEAQTARAAGEFARDLATGYA